MTKQYLAPRVDIWHRSSMFAAAQKKVMIRYLPWWLVSWWRRLTAPIPVRRACARCKRTWQEPQRVFRQPAVGVCWTCVLRWDATSLDLLIDPYLITLPLPTVDEIERRERERLAALPLPIIHKDFHLNLRVVHAPIKFNGDE